MVDNLHNNRHDLFEMHEYFWNGNGPSLILIPPFHGDLYDLKDYPSRFYDPRAMWESEVFRAGKVAEWPTDGIPTVRPNLGVITIPAMVGQSFLVPEDSMPWPGKPLSLVEISNARKDDLASSEIYRLAVEFYKIHQGSTKEKIYPYLPDTQGVFDIAHLLYGDAIFCEMLNDEQGGVLYELMETSLDLYLKATNMFKSLIGEPPDKMVHGHGTEQGVYFPHAGVRVAEDTAVLLSPDMIEEFIIPYIQRSVEPYGGGFLHYCGHHPTIFTQFSAMPEIRAIDLGNPEKYDTRWLLERCAETNTVLYSRIAEESGESWRDYIKRIGSLVVSTGARVILRPLVFPGSYEESIEMLDLWHDITS